MNPLHFVICGGADGDRRTLIERLLRESTLLDADPSATLDAADRTFCTDTRRFLLTESRDDASQPTNLVAEASTAHAAVIVIDAAKGVLTETRRHTYLATLLGIRKVALAIDNFDAVGFSKDVFERIETEYRALALRVGLRDVVCVPGSALRGDNATAPSANTPWYRGPTLMGYLETVEPEADVRGRPFRMPVEQVNRPAPGSCGVSGRVVAGTVKPGDRVRVLPAGRECTVARVVTDNRDLAVAAADQSVTVTLEDELAINPGDLLSAADSPAGVADQFEATVIWLSGEEMLPGRSYLLRIGPRTVGATMATPKYKVNVDTLEHLAARTLRANEIGVCNLNLDQPIAFDPYEENHDTGRVVLIDRLTNDTVGTGLLRFALRRSQNIHWQAIEVNKQAHATLNGHKPCVVWFTGLSGAGKSTIANILEKKLHALGLHTYLLDGDNVRHGLNKDLGFTEADRVENIRRIAEVARLMIDAGLIVLVSFISPFRAERRFARERVDAGEFCEVFVDAPLAVAERRDRKGFYKKARCGELKNFTGIDSPYEPPEHPAIRIDTTVAAPEDAAESIVAHLRRTGVLGPS